MNSQAKSLLEDYKNFAEEAQDEGKDVAEALEESDEWTIIRQ